jgi:hypothetical protein
MKKPPWHAIPEEMEKWVNEKLNAGYADEGGSHVEFMWIMDDDARRIYAAEHGDIEPLKQKYPHLAPYLCLPKRKRGVRFFKPEHPWWQYDNPFLALGHALQAEDKVQCALDDVKRIRAIWRKEYGRYNRSDLISAEQIAANRWGVDVEDIFTAQRHPKKP